MPRLFQNKPPPSSLAADPVHIHHSRAEDLDHPEVYLEFISEDIDKNRTPKIHVYNPMKKEIESEMDEAQIKPRF